MVAQIGLGIYVGVQEKFSERMTEIFIHSKWDQHKPMGHIDSIQNMVKKKIDLMRDYFFIYFALT